MYFLYKNEYRILKPAEITIKKRTIVERRKMEGMNQFRIQNIYTRKCHNETLCIAILNKQKHIILKKGGQEDKTVPVLELIQVGGEGYRERRRAW
jgi:hypothetical protein